jgi:hypothetical protein
VRRVSIGCRLMAMLPVFGCSGQPAPSRTGEHGERSNDIWLEGKGLPIFQSCGHRELSRRSVRQPEPGGTGSDHRIGAVKHDPTASVPAMNDSALCFRRWAVILAAGLSGVTVLISMLFDPAPDAEGRELIQAYAANDRAQGLHTNLIHYGFALFAPVAYAMVGLVRRRGAWIANLAGLLAVLGLSTLPGLVFIDYFSVAVEHVAGLEAAVNAEGAVEKLPGFAAVTVPAFISAILAVPVASLAGSPGGLVDTARSSGSFSWPEFSAGPGDCRVLGNGGWHARCRLGAMANSSSCLVRH